MTSPLIDRCLKVEYVSGHRCDSYNYGVAEYFVPGNIRHSLYDVDDDIYVEAEECKQCLEIISGKPLRIVDDSETGPSITVVDFPECYNNATFSNYPTAKDCAESMMNAELGATYMISTDENIFWFLPNDYTVVRVY